MTREQVQEALRGRLGSEVVEHTGVCESVLRTLLRYAPYRDTLDDLEKRVDSGEMAVAFALYPTQMTELTAVADSGQVMPPKSTWFEPKLVDGLVSNPL